MDKKCYSCRWHDQTLETSCQLNYAVAVKCQSLKFYRWEPPIKDDADDEALDKSIEREG